MAYSQFLNCWVRRFLLVFVWVFLLLGMTGSTGWAASWLIYHKPAFAGQILDGETKKGIEGAAVVALYYKESTGIAGGSDTVIRVREAVTDTEGKFHLPSYTTFIAPWSWESGVRFIIYKPGYVGILENLEAEFSGGEVAYPNLDVPWLYNPELIFRYREPNIVELPPARRREDRIKAQTSPYGEKNDYSKQKKLIKLIRAEYEFLYAEDPNDLYLPIGGL